MYSDPVVDFYHLSEEETAESDNGSKCINTDQEILLKAIDNGDINTAKELLCDKGLCPNFVFHGRSPICSVVSLGQEEMLELLISSKSSLTTPCLRDTMWLRHPIHLAASKGHKNIVSRLVENGVDINSKDSDHRTPLHWAATYGQVETAQVLLQKGAVVNVTQSDGFTPLHAATCLGHNSVCRTLIEHGAEVNKADAEGWNALHTAVCYGQAAVVQTLLNSNAAIKSVTLDQNTTLHVAASSGHLQVMEILLAHSLDLNVKNMQGFTPFHLALYHSKIDASKLLIKYGANIQTSDSNGQSPLYLVASRMDMAVVHLLLLAGYDFSKERWIRNNIFPFVVTKMPTLCEMLKHYASNVRSLQDLACFKIRKLIIGNIDNKVESLPIPKSLKDILAYRCEDFNFKNESRKTAFFSTIQQAWVFN